VKTSPKTEKEHFDRKTSTAKSRRRIKREENCKLWQKEVEMEIRDSEERSWYKKDSGVEEEVSDKIVSKEKEKLRERVARNH